MESVLQRKIVQRLEKWDWYVVKIILCNKTGFPDLMACRNGRVVFIEVKDEGKFSAPLQKFRHEQLKKLDFDVLVIDTWEQFMQHRRAFDF